MSINRQPRATDQPAPTLRFGDRLGEFVINGFAGVGATSYVYRARHETSFEPVAIKVLHPHLLNDQIKRTRFLREAQMMMGFQHPNVVRFKRILDDPDNLAFVMEYIEGDTLETWLEKNKGKVDQQEVLGVFVDLLRGLNHAHSGGVVHRDLKPANILITQEDGRSRAKIIDFGVARFSSLPTPPEDKKKIVGTAAYISPEEVRDPETVCQQSDIYSIGVMLYEAVCGQRPFANMGVKELMKAHVSESPESPTAINPEVGPALESVIMRTLAKTPEGRYDNVPSLISAIEWSMSSPSLPVQAEPFLARTAEFHRPSDSTDPNASVMGFFRQALMMAMTIFVVSGAGTRSNSAHHLDRFDDGHLPFG